MTVGDLIDSLKLFDPKLQVEIATSPHEDEWYECWSVETLPNFRGKTVLVINTD